MGLSFILSIIASVVVSAIFIGLQYRFYRETRNNRDRYQSFFEHKGNYSTTIYETSEGKEISLISEGNLDSGDLLTVLFADLFPFDGDLLFARFGLGHLHRRKVLLLRNA